MAGNSIDYAIGTRCRLSELGEARSPRMPGRHGTIVGRGRAGNRIGVLLDGSKVPVALHTSYIEQLPEAEITQNDGLATK